MSKTLKTILIIIGVFLAIGMVFFIYVSNKLEGLEDTSVDKDYMIVFDETKDTFFIKASSWGLTGDHIQIQLSSFPIINRAYDSTKNIIFYEPTIYCQQMMDSLIIYSPSISNLPSQMATKIKIKQVELGPGDIIRYEQDYKHLGLKKVSVYN
jgi:hypothetical protein